MADRATHIAFRWQRRRATAHQSGPVARTDPFSLSNVGICPTFDSEFGGSSVVTPDRIALFEKCVPAFARVVRRIDDSGRVLGRLPRKFVECAHRSLDEAQ